MTHDVFIGSTYAMPITVADDALVDLLDFLEEHRVCKRCERCYSDENPRVQPNCCLQCLCTQARQKHGALRLLGFVCDEQGRCRTQLIDQQGIIHVTGLDFQTDVDENSLETLLTWQYRPPITLVLRGFQVRLHASNWSIYGDVLAQPVLVAGYDDHRRDFPVHLLFLLTRYAGWQILTKRLAAHRQVFEQATRQLMEERTIPEGRIAKADLYTRIGVLVCNESLVAGLRLF